MNIKNEKVKQAVTSLTFKSEFFASTALQMKYIEDLKCKTYWTDGKNIGYNPNFADSISLEKNIGVVAHEVCHVVLLHHARLGERDVEVFNQAADFCINPILIKAGFELPDGVLLDWKYENMSVEDIYRALMLEKVKKEVEKEKKNGKKSDSGEENDGGGGKSEESEENKPAPDCGFGEIRQNKECDAKEIEESAIIMGKMAENVAKLCGSLPAGMERMLKDAREVKTDWREVLNRFLNEVSAKDYSFSRPNTRFLGRGFILPSLYSKAIGKVIIAVDTSGSVDEKELARLITEVTKILDYINESKDCAEIDIIYFDHKVQGHETYTGSEILKPKGGGGTCFKSWANYIEDKDLNPDLCIVLTDGCCNSFPAPLDYPVLWALTLSYYAPNMPFGEKMILS